MNTSDSSNSSSIEYIKNTSGKNIAKLLLANQRLDSQVLREDVKIFEKESSSLNKRYTKKINYQNDSIGKLTVDGDMFRWSDFAEYNNSLSYFNCITGLIKYYSEKGAKLIDDIKLNVSEFDKWIEYENAKYFLSVNQNFDYLYKIDNDGLFICEHYLNDNGQTVYEIYSERNNVVRRIKHIPNMRYEFTQIGEYVPETYFVADYSKGYWEVSEITSTSTKNVYNVLFYMMKNDIYYSIIYTISQYNDFQPTPIIKVMSADVSTDIFSYSYLNDTCRVSISLSGFNGIECVEAPSSDVEYNNDDGTAFLKSCVDTKVKLTNGKNIIKNQSFFENMVQVENIYVDNLVDGYVGTIELCINSGNQETVWNTVKSFINETGLVCKRNIDDVINGVIKADRDANDTINYYKMNDCTLNNVDSIVSALQFEVNRINDFKTNYNNIKNNEIIDYSNSIKVDLNLDFPKLIDNEIVNAKIQGNAVTIDKLSYSLDNVVLLDENEMYHIEIGLLNDEDNLFTTYVSNENNHYSGGNTFTIDANMIEFNMPESMIGDYSIVAYISTVDGIRVSDYNRINFSEVSDLGVDNGIIYEKNYENYVIVHYLSEADHHINLEINDSIEYNEFCDMLSCFVYKYGTPSNDLIEVLKDNTYVSLSLNDEIKEGTYRMKYVLDDGIEVLEGYIYFDCAIISLS